MIVLAWLNLEKILSVESFQEKCSDQTNFINNIIQNLQQIPNVRTIELDFSTADSTSNARIELLKVREDLARQASEIDKAIREADRLCNDGAEILTPEQFNALKESRQRLQQQYKSLIDYTDNVLKRLDVATSLLIEFTKKSTDFQNWMYSKSKNLEQIRYRSGDPARINESKREAKILHDEIINNEDALREISQLGLRIEVEVKNYIDELKRQEPNAKHPPLNSEEIQNTIGIIQENYETLIKDSNSLIQFLNKLKSLSIDYDHHINDVNQWLSGLEKSIRENDPNSDNQKSEELLEKLKILSENAIANQPKLEAASQASKELVDATISTDAHDSLKKQQKMILQDMERRYHKLNDVLKNNVDIVKSEITNKEGVKQGLDNMIQWLDKERRDTNQSLILPLIMDKLKAQKYSQQLKESEMNSQEKILNDLEKSLEKMKQMNLKIVQDEKLDEKFKKAFDEFIKLKRDRHGFSENLNDVIKSLENLNSKADNLNKKLNKFNDDLDKIDPTDENGMKNMEGIFSNLIDNEWNEITDLAKKILNLPGIEETQNLNDLMKGLEKSLNRTQNKLTDKHTASNKLANNKVNFGAKFEKVEQELTEIEMDLQHQLLDISIDENFLQEQREICQELNGRLINTRTQVEEIEKLGTELIQSSGIVSKRKSMDLSDSDGIGQIAKQIFNLRSRQDEAERVLHDLMLKINENDEKRKIFDTKQNDFKKWLEEEKIALKQRQNMSLENVDLETTSKEIKMVDKKFREKHPEIGQLHAMMNQLMNLGAYDSRQNEIDEIQQNQIKIEKEFEMLEKENNELETVVAIGIILLNDGLSIEKWINSKTRVLDICTVSTDNHLMDNNLTLLDFLLNEMEDEKSKFLKFNQIGQQLKEISKTDDFKNQVENKVEEINKKWKNLEDILKNKIDDLNKAKNLVQEFDQIEKNIKKNLNNFDYLIDDGFKTALINPQKNEEYIKMLDTLDFSPISNELDDLEKINEKMDELTTDPGIRSGIKNRINSLKNSQDEMLKKIDSMKNAALNAKNQGNELFVEYENALEWIQNANENLNLNSGISADNGKLKEQMDKFEKIYKEGLEKEGPMMLLKAKLADSIGKSNSKDLKEKLEFLSITWDPLLNQIKEKHQKMKNLKELIEEFGDLEVEIKNGLTEIQTQIENFKETEEKNDDEIIDLEPTKQFLNSLKPKIDGLFNLIKKIEIIAPGPDSKKLNRDVENLLNDSDLLSKELTNQTKMLQNKNDLRNNFEKSIISGQKMLENVRQNLKLNDNGISTLTKEKLQNFLDETKNNWSKIKREVDSAAEKLKPIVDDFEIEEINDAVGDLEKSYDEIMDEMKKSYDEIEKIENLINLTTLKNLELKNEIDDLGEKISDLQSFGRDFDELKKQENECDEIYDEIANKEEKIDMLALEWKNHVDNGKILSSQTAQKELEQMKHKIEQQKKKINNRKRQIKHVIDGINNLSNNVKILVGELENIEKDEIFNEPIAVELNELRRQQQGMKQFKTNDVKPLTEKVDEIAENIKEFIRSADPDVQTKDLEGLLKQLTGKMNDINATIDERERRIEGAIQGLGLYNDSYKSLLNWIEEVEEIVANQKPPSADFKVTKAQLQTHDFQMKLIDDKQSSIDGFLAMMDKVYAGAQDDESKAAIKAKADDIASRYNALVDGAHQRRAQLLEASALGEEFSTIVKPLTQWLESASKEIQSLTSIPTNKEKLDKQIKSQEDLLDVIDSKRDDVDHLWNVYTELSRFVGSDDAIELETTVTTLTEKYNDLGLRCKSLGTSLNEMKKSITSFLEDADNLSQWLDYTEKEIEKFGDMSIYPEELIIQSEMLATLVNSVVQRQDLVSRVVQDSNELCRHTSGSEASSLQYRIENLRHRYSHISKEADDKITTLTLAIPLSEEISTIFEEINHFIDDCETDLDNLEQLPLDEQNNILIQLENDLLTMKNDMDLLNEKSMELQHLSSKKKADELAKRTNELNREFNNLSDKISKKSDNLNLAEKQSRKIFDDLNYLYDWFTEAKEKIENFDKPTIETEKLKLQIKNQKLMNDDILTEKLNLREIILKSNGIIHDLKLTIGGQDILLLNKIDETKKLSDDVLEMGKLRLEEFEQAFVLAKELEMSYTEISEWLDDKDEVLRNCEIIHTGMSPENLMKLKNQNNDILQNYRDQKSIIMKFERNIGILSELASKNESENLNEIGNGIIERFTEQEKEFQQRGKILDETIEQSSVFGDRLDTFLSNLESANNKIRNPESISSRPPLIKRQINDNESIISLFNQKEDAFRIVKDDANGILAQCLPGDPTVSEISQKINALDILWFEIQDGLDRRQNFLHETLQKAEKFWNELENCQKSINEIKKNLDSIHLTAADPKKLEENKMLLDTVGIGIDETNPKLHSLRYVGGDLIQNIADDEKQQIEYQINNVENDMVTVTGIYNQMTNNLIDAMSKSMNFHELLRQLLIWLNQEEQNISNLGNIPSNLAEIQLELQKLEKIRTEIDEKSILHEQLNFLANELYANANSNQINVLRGQMNELNGRWNKLYQIINDRQQKLEKLLLEFGQFEQAYLQLISWIDKTEKILDDINPICKDLKQIEIEFCKLKVIQNDISSHVTSFDGITKIGKLTNPEKIEILNEKWKILNEKIEILWKKLEISKQETTNFDGEYDRWILWLEDLLTELSYSKPIGGLIETSENQLEDFQIIKADVEEKKLKIENEIDKISKQILTNSNPSENSYLQKRHDNLEKMWKKVNEKMIDREAKLKIALRDATALEESMNDMTKWLDDSENHLNNLPLISRLIEPLEKQIDEHQLFTMNVNSQREKMSDLNTRGTKIQFACEKKDAIPIKNRLISLKHRFDKVANRTADRTKLYDNAFGESQTYFNAHADLTSFLDRISQTLKEEENIPTDSSTGDRLRNILEENKNIIEEIQSKKPIYESTEKRGKTLEDHSPSGEKSKIHEYNSELAKKWKHVNSEAFKRQRSIEDALVQCGKFDEALSETFSWLNSKLPTLESEVESGNILGDNDTVERLNSEHCNLADEMKRRKSGIDQLKNRAEKILDAPETSESEKNEIREKMNKLDNEWERLEKAWKIKDEMLTDAIGKAFDLHHMLDNLNEKGAKAEDKLKKIGNILPDEESEVLDMLNSLKEFEKELEEKLKPEVEKAMKLGKQIQQKAHPIAEIPLKNILRTLSGRWDSIDQQVGEKHDKLKKHLDELKEHDKKLEEIGEFIGSKESAIEFVNAESDATSLAQLEEMKVEHDLFKQELNEKQPEIDEMLRIAKKNATKSDSITSGDHETNSPTTPTTPTSRNPKPLLRGNTKMKILQPKKSKRLQKSDQLGDRWKKLWEHSQAYDEKLKARKEYLEEMKRLEGFTFDDWRERYLQWNDTGKARISDLFRKIDTSRTGIIPRESFIKGILDSKFPTTPLEMVKVANEFDKGDGMISAKEFMNALRYDPKKRPPPKTEAEIIHEELRKETERCTCAHRFPITHLSTNENRVQYGFGFGSTMKRMVRILRSTVMVRVGGGWERLDEFLVKHDPCRAAGRMNINIHQSPENALDQMHEFKTRRWNSSGSSSLSGSREVLSYVGTPGPISKVREKTDRSVPMFKKPQTPKTSVTGISPLASYTVRRASDMNYGDSKIPRPSPTVSRSSSRQNISQIATPVSSRPPSRMSGEDPDDRPPSRIPSIRGAKGVRYQPGSSSSSKH